MDHICMLSVGMFKAILFILIGRGMVLLQLKWKSSHLHKEHLVYGQHNLPCLLQGSIYVPVWPQMHFEMCLKVRKRSNNDHVNNYIIHL